MKKLTIRGHNIFYEGWLRAVLMQPIPEGANNDFKYGYAMAQETGVEFAIGALPEEVELKHIIVEEQQ